MFTDSLNFQALDAYLRPLENVAVGVTFQRDFTSSKGYVTTKNFYTNSRGLVQINVTNTEQLEDKVDCQIRIAATFDNSTVTRSVTANSHSNPIDLNFDTVKLNIRVLDHENKPARGAEVWVNSQLAKFTDKDGLADFNANRGKVTIFAKYLSGKIEKSIDLKDDERQELGFFFYSLVVKIFDDQERPLVASVTVGNKTIISDPEGKAFFEFLVGENQEIKVIYKNLEKRISVVLPSENLTIVSFDFTQPTILKITPMETPTATRFIISAKDDGKHASGIGTGGVLFQYKVNASSLQTARIFLRQRNEFVAEIPKAKEGSTVLFSVEVKDRAGNTQRIEGAYNPKSKDNETAVDVVPIKPAPPPPEDGLGLVLMASTVAGIAVIIYWFYRTKVGGGEQ